MDEDQILQSIIADPQLTDPSIDVGQLRQTTPTRTELLANVPEFSGLKFDPTQRSYIEDLYSVYGGGLPTIPEPVIEDTAQIPGAVDTLVDVGGGGGQDQVTGDSVLDTPTLTTPTVTEPVGGGADMGTVPATEQVGGITSDPIDVGIPDNESGFVDPLGTIGGAPDVFDINVVGDPALNPGSVMVQGEDPYGTPEQNLVSQAFSKVGSTATDIMNDLSQIPGAITDFANQTVDIAGQKINVGKTLLSAGINRIVGGPISLVFDAIGALASNLPPGISETTNKAREVGLIVGDGTVTQDKYGINTQSAFGDYNQYNLDRVEQLQAKDNKTPRDEQELIDRQNYIDSTGAAGDITPDATPLDIATGNITGDGAVAEQEVEKEKQQAFADIQNQIGQTRDQDPAPAPAPAPAPSYYGGGADRDRGNGGGGGGGGGSPGSAGPGGSDEMGSF